MAGSLSLADHHAPSRRRTLGARARGPLPGLLLAVLLALITAGCAHKAEREKVLKEAELHYQLGDGDFRDHRINEAIRELVRAIQVNPDHVAAHNLLGFIYLGRQEYDRALAEFKRVVALEPGFLEAQNNLGAAHLALCQWEEAAAIFRRLEQDPLYQTPYVALNNLGLAQLNLGQPEDAVRSFQRSVFLNPSFCVGFNNLGRTLLDLGRLEEAERALGQALAVDPACTRGYAEPHLHLGRLHEQLGHPDQALAEYRSCVELTRGAIELGQGCGSEPAGVRCEQKVRQLESLGPLR